MNPLNIIRLDLYAPLFYSKDEGLDPFAYTSLSESEESLFCFEIVPTQYQSIEPDAAQYLGNLLCKGKSSPESSSLLERIELPAGKYLFAQVRELLSREAVIAMAIEVQKDGLWERVTLENRIYLRYLFEDGKSVTQVFRPYS